MKRYFITLMFIFFIKGLFAQTINYIYDDLGRLTQTIYPDSSIINYSYDPSGNRTNTVTENICFIKPKPAITATGNIVLCSGDSVILTSASSARYAWSTGGNTQSIVVKQSGKYAVRADYSSTCSKTSDTVFVTVKPSPKAVITASGNTSICSGDSLILKADTSRMYSYMWSTGSASTSIIAKTSEVYKLKVNTADGCSDSANISIKVNPIPSLSTTPATQTVCSGVPISTINILNPNSIAGTTFTWTRDNTTNLTGIAESGSGENITGILTNTTSTTQTTKFTITATANECSSTTVVAVGVNPKPSISTTPATQTVCSGVSINTINILNPNSVAGTTFSWIRDNTTSLTGILANGDGGNIIGTLTNTTSTSQTTTFTITATANGCSSASTVTAIVNPLPVVNTGENKIICYESSVVIGSPLVPGYSYSWLPVTGLSSASSPNPTANPLVSTTYTVKVTNGFGCSATGQTTVNVNSLPIVSPGNPIAIRKGGKITIGGNPTAFGNQPFTYNWVPAIDLNSNTLSNPVANPISTTTYTVRATDKNSCSDTGSIIVSVIPTNQNFFVYPNPSTGIIKIIGADVENGNWRISVTSELGRIVYINDKVQASNNSLFHELSLLHVPSSVYYISFEKGDWKTVLKIVKQK